MLNILYNIYKENIMNIITVTTPDNKTRAFSSDQISYVEKIEGDKICLIQLNNGSIAFQAEASFDEIIDAMRKI